MNSINNNQIQNLIANDFMESSDTMTEPSPQISEQMSAWNDNNNNSDENLGPETNVDEVVVSEELTPESDGGDKEKMQVELKEAEEVDHTTEPSQMMGESDMYQLPSQAPEPLKESNPFATQQDFTHVEMNLEAGIPVEDFAEKPLDVFNAVTENARFDDIVEESSAEAAFGDHESLQQHHMEGVSDEPESLQHQMSAGKHDAILAILKLFAPRDKCANTRAAWMTSSSIYYSMDQSSFHIMSKQIGREIFRASACAVRE
jgi:hypothetical protein